MANLKLLVPALAVDFDLQRLMYQYYTLSKNESEENPQCIPLLVKKKSRKTSKM